MNTDHAHPAELAALRTAFEADAPLGWDRVHAFEAEHGIVLPEPYRTFVAEISDGSYAGPPDYGLMPLAELPDDGREADGERCLAEPFPLTEAWVWEEDDRPEEELEPLLDQVFSRGDRRGRVRCHRELGLESVRIDRGRRGAPPGRGQGDEPATGAARGLHRRPAARLVGLPGTVRGAG
ncbi:SMI1/KNR4 family protein [Streptomyces sp. NPDC002346]